MLGGSSFGVSNDNPYWFPGNTVHHPNLMSQLDAAGKGWRGYFQGMPYAGYRGYCYPDRCNGIPDADTQYVSKHNGIVNFANLQNPADMARMLPLGQLTVDLAQGTVPALSYIVPDECNDMHGAPPWCVDSGNPGTLQQDWLISNGDKFVGTAVHQITASSTWGTGRDAIVVTFDEGNQASSRIATIVVANHGPRGLLDGTLYDHYSLLASLEGAFGLGCLANSCHTNLMGPLFAITHSKSVPALPGPFPFPSGRDTISPQGFGRSAGPVSLNSTKGWSVVPSVSFGTQDNVLSGVSAASSNDAWAVGTYYPTATGPLATLAEHFDGTRWTAFPLPNVGAEENTLLGVSMPTTDRAWAVGYFVNGHFEQRTLIEHFNGRAWSVVPSPNPGTAHDILYSVSAVSDSDVWAVGTENGVNGLWQTLTEHWDGSAWKVVPSPNPGPAGDRLYGVTAVATQTVYAVGQAAGAHFPNRAIVLQWDGSDWDPIAAPSDPSSSALPLGVTATGAALTIVGQQESDRAGYLPYVAAGAPHALLLQTTALATSGENDLFGVARAADGSLWAVGWAVYDPSNDTYLPLILHYQHGTWSVATSPHFGPGSTAGFSSVTAIPGGGLWAVGVTESATSSFGTLIEYHP